METTTSKPVEVTAPTHNPVDKLVELSARIGQLAHLIKELASEISDATIEVQGQIESNDADSQKLKQLQSLLKSLG